MTSLLRVLLAIYNFIAGDIVILVGTGVAFVILAILSRGAGVQGLAAGGTLFLCIGVTLVATLLRERPAGAAAETGPDQTT